MFVTPGLSLVSSRTQSPKTRLALAVLLFAQTEMNLTAALVFAVGLSVVQIV